MEHPMVLYFISYHFLYEGISKRETFQPCICTKKGGKIANLSQIHDGRTKPEGVLTLGDFSHLLFRKFSYMHYLKIFFYLNGICIILNMYSLFRWMARIKVDLWFSVIRNLVKSIVSDKQCSLGYSIEN